MSAIIKMTIEFDGRFVLSHRDDSLLPPHWLRDKILSKYPDLTVVECVRATLVLSGAIDEDQLKADIMSWLKTKYKITESDKVVEFLAEADEQPTEDASASKKTKASKSKSGKPQSEESSEKKSGSSDFNRRNRFYV